MSTWLKLLPLELDEVTELKEPTGKIQAGDTQHGQVPDELKKIWTLCSAMSKQAALLQVEQKYDPTDERKAKICELSFKARALTLIFWIGAQDSLGLWGTTGQLDLREGWEVVTFVPKASIMGFPLNFLDGPQE